MDKMDNNPQINSQPSVPSFVNPKTVIISSIILLISAFIIFSSLSSNRNNADSTQNTSSQKNSTSLADNTLVYGIWDVNGAKIRTYDLKNNDQKLIANLPLNIKKVTVLSPDKLLYIADTDENDYGKEISLYTISTQKTQTVYKTSDGFGIDDYVISLNKNYLSVWEVQQNIETNTLLNGKSRVYNSSLQNPGTKYLIYDEIASSPVHYPRAVLNDGTIFTDRFMPNDGAGWAYGMSKSDFTGNNKQDIASMSNGTYSTQPVLSPDSNYLVFAGYDGSYGIGSTLNNGFRQAILTPNTLELLDVQSLSRRRLPKITATDIYSSIDWTDSNNIIFTVISKTPSANGTYSYNIQSQTLTQLNTANAVADSMSISTLLTGVQDDSSSTLGNLGNNYQSLFTSFSVLDAKSGKESVLPLSGKMMQFITTTPSNYFTSGITDSEGSKQNLQILSFYIKPSLEPKRVEQQSSRKGLPKCREYTTQQCNQLLGTNYSSPDKFRVDPSWSEEFQACFNTQRKKNNVGGAVCSDSPLYLYGPEGSTINVKINTQIFNSNPAYNDGYVIILGKNGSMQINNSQFDKIDYDYTSAVRTIKPPHTGYILKKVEIAQKLEEMANNLGLNEKESKDLVAYAEVVNTPFVFVSFFDQKMSHAILPISFNPKPDVYRNIVFYFKKLPQNPGFVPDPPVYPQKINRSGITAVEISAIID